MLKQPQPHLSPYNLAYPAMLLNLVAPKLKEGKDQKHHIFELASFHFLVATEDHGFYIVDQFHDSQCLAPEEKVAPAQVVDEIVQRLLSGIPLRLIDLNTGTFRTSAELLRLFKRSPEYQTLVSSNSLTTEDLAEKAEEVTRKYFAYVMLSHVWGEDEPLYGEVKLIANVLDMSSSCPGNIKLQHFCRVAKQQGFNWCWSDTCCIDKTSSAELQESINSMFTWYRNSALTIGFLSDVLQHTADALRRSRWFTRGWTLQELLAPRAIQFYMGDWTPFLPSNVGGAATPQNYKLFPEFVQCLENILGIDKAYLVDFNPGLEDVRERLRWMAMRRTTKVEDRAYCLLGILDLRLPILYGEGDRSFIRLQDEIMKNTDDTCIFDWVGKPSSLNSYLARSPSCFRQPTWRPPSHNEVPLLEAMSDFTHKLSTAFMRIAESLLAEPPLGHFIANGRMNLRTFVYQVKSVTLTASTQGRRNKWMYAYKVSAEGLEPVTVITSHEFVNTRTAARSLSIGRVWDNMLRAMPGTRGGSSNSSSSNVRKGTNESDEVLGEDLGSPTSPRSEDYTAILAKRMREPFVAQLLFVHPDGQFRRIHTEERIIAQPRFVELLDLRSPRTLIVH